MAGHHEGRGWRWRQRARRLGSGHGGQADVREAGREFRDLGNTVAYVAGASKGASSVHAKYGVDIDKQARNLVQTYDTSRNGVLELDPSGRPAGEYLRQTTYRDPYSKRTIVDWKSVENAARAADASGDSVVTSAEVKGLFGRFDANGDGLLQLEEREAFTRAGYEHDAYVEVVQPR